MCLWIDATLIASSARAGCIDPNRTADDSGMLQIKLAGKGGGCFITAIWLDVPVEECIRRAVARKNHPTLQVSTRI